MLKYLIPYAAAAIVMVALDILWLGFVARGLYRDGLGPLMADKVNGVAAIAFYLLYILGLLIFAIGPNGGDWLRATLYGALFGFFAYATYDLTNLATLRGFPLSLALTDMAWGTLLSALASAAGALAMRSA